MKNKLRLIFILLLALPLPASAVCVLCSCTIAINSSVAFGTYDPRPGTALDSGLGHFTVSCTAGIGLLGSFTVKLTAGGSNSYSPRKMSSGVNTLNYNLYMDAARTTVWGDGTGGTSFVNDPTVLNIGNFVRQYDVYGRILANQRATPPGTYSDTITVTVVLN